MKILYLTLKLKKYLIKSETVSPLILGLIGHLLTSCICDIITPQFIVGARALIICVTIYYYTLSSFIYFPVHIHTIIHHQSNRNKKKGNYQIFKP